ncbi:hypothetical protein B0T16DRAFT_507978 [Cercophora newfieldiana]|uniref:Uncharacterized protein n=1 Tax=Cercophora newfieldiana TaxID=92897 RepID=A0AA39YD29_9PEZI|nr:hypothetical protein B0T16DRAFT_507978 [Cercophora newfieldiana]
MEPIGRPRIRFVHVDNPTKPDQNHARQVRSHAARETHARARRLRVISHLGLSNPSLGPLETLDSAISESTQEKPIQEGNDSNLSSLLPAGRQDPFAAFVRSLDPIEHFLLDHYVRVVIPVSSQRCNGLKDSKEGAFYADWVPCALADVGLLSGIFLAACRDLSIADHARKSFFSTMALRYKVSCLRALKFAIAADLPALSDADVAKVVCLVSDEVGISFDSSSQTSPREWLTLAAQIELGNMETSKSHVLGVMKMVDLRGGPQKLGLNGLLEFILKRLIHDKGIFEQYELWATHRCERCESPPG